MNVAYPIFASVPALTSNDVHVWFVDMANVPDAASEDLAQDEKERARRFYHEKDQRRFITARSFLRQMLAGYLKTEPKSIIFSYGEHGKPYIDGAQLQFNLSHSDSMLLVGVSQQEIGVDVEKISATVDIESIAKTYFSAAQANELESIPDAKKRLRFFEIWTETEALQKALGVGMTDEIISDTSSWHVQLLAAPANYVAALATQGRDLKIGLIPWNL